MHEQALQLLALSAGVYECAKLGQQLVARMRLCLRMVGLMCVGTSVLLGLATCVLDVLVYCFGFGACSTQAPQADDREEDLPRHSSGRPTVESEAGKPK